MPEKGHADDAEHPTPASTQQPADQPSTGDPANDSLLQLLTASPIGASIATLDGHCLFANPVLTRLLGLSADPTQSIDLGRLYQRPEQFIRHMKLLGADRGIRNAEVNLVNRDGSVLWIRLSHEQLRFQGQEAVLSWYVDLTRERQALEELDQQRRHYQALITQSAEGISLLGADASILYESPSNKRILGYDPMDMYRKNLYTLIHPEDRPRVREKFRQLLEIPDNMVSLEARLLHKDGTWRVLQSTLRNALDDPSTGGIINNFRDITEQRTLEDRLRRLATQDDLTGVYNRRYFMELAEQELARLHRYQVALSLLLLDIDHFKKINDNHGHAVGDEVLRQMGALLGRLRRQNDIAGRIGGEEFAVVMPSTGLAGATDFAQRLRQALAGRVLATAAGALRITASIGVAACELHDPSIDVALQRADQAMYLAKSGGRNRVEVYKGNEDDTA